ncbi:amidohydrolase family protein [Formosa sp. A9]|uniref:amidohydrolase family protein n=1 Tax=Formosa sp. A9 TaxID=3442641 RepID=UPI003EC010DC
MKNIGVILLLLSAMFAAVSCKEKETIDLLISNTSIISVENEAIEENKDILIKEGKIFGISNHKKSYNAYTIKEKINAEGKFVMPSLIDMHVHIPDGLSKTILPMYFANGISLVRSMRAVDSYSKIKEGLSDKYYYPSIYFSSPTISRKLDFDSEEVDSLFSKYAIDGYDFTKILSVKDSTVFKNIVTSAEKYNIELAGHYLPNIPKSLFYKANYKTVEHLGGFIHNDSLDLSSLKEFITRNIYMCPTLNWYYISDKIIEENQILNKEEYSRFIPNNILEIWKERYISKNKNVTDYTNRIKAVENINAVAPELIIAGGDSNIYIVPGFGLYDELNRLEDAGLSPFQILKTATVNSAKCLNIFDKTGSVDIGKEASLLILNENPIMNLSSLKNIYGIFYKNRYSDRTTLDLILKKSISELKKTDRW